MRKSFMIASRINLIRTRNCCSFIIIHPLIRPVQKGNKNNLHLHIALNITDAPPILAVARVFLQPELTGSNWEIKIDCQTTWCTESS